MALLLTQRDRRASRSIPRWPQTIAMAEAVTAIGAAT
jgi:hypothetical protein